MPYYMCFENFTKILKEQVMKRNVSSGEIKMHLGKAVWTFHHIGYHHLSPRKKTSDLWWSTLLCWE